MDDLIAGPDGRPRCGWCAGDDLYRAYHDDEWGRPVHDERRLYEKICLEGFQSGLSWLIVLRKRPALREVFADFDPEVVADFGMADVERLIVDGRIIRHRGKITATISNARAVTALHAAGTSLDELAWSFAPESPPTAPQALADVPAQTPGSAALSAELKRRGFRFVGPITCYAFMQAMGMVNDHLVGCAVGDALRPA